MNILFFSSYPNFSGSHKMALQLAAFARGAGHHVLIGAPEDNTYLEKARALGFETHIYQAPHSLLITGGRIAEQSGIQKIKMALCALLPYQFRLIKSFKQQKPDLIYIAQERGVLQIGIAAKMLNIPVVWHLQGGVRDDAARIHRLAAVLSDHIICVSRAVQDDLASFISPKARKKMALLYNGLPDIKRVPRKSGAQKQRLLLAGNITPHKGAHILIEAISHLPRDAAEHIELNIAGWISDEGYESYLKALIRRHKLEGVIHIKGYIEDIETLIARSHIVICPSIERGEIEINAEIRQVHWKEGFNLCALEAMRAQRPVICSASYGLKEVVEHNITGLHVPPGDAHALAAALERLLSDKDDAARMAEQGRARYERLFTQDNMRQKFIEILGKIK